jgi:hypothetical protein
VPLGVLLQVNALGKVWDLFLVSEQVYRLLAMNLSMNLFVLSHAKNQA